MSSHPGCETLEEAPGEGKQQHLLFWGRLFCLLTSAQTPVPWISRVQAIPWSQSDIPWDFWTLASCSAWSGGQPQKFKAIQNGKRSRVATFSPQKQGQEVVWVQLWWEQGTGRWGEVSSQPVLPGSSGLLMVTRNLRSHSQLMGHGTDPL